MLYVYYDIFLLYLINSVVVTNKMDKFTVTAASK